MTKAGAADDSDHEFLLSQRDFERLAHFVSGHTGIRLPPVKRAMVEGRLRRRVRALGFADFGAYCAYVFKENGLAQEGEFIIDAITTNKTDFFREPDHFRFLEQMILPQLASEGRIGFTEPFLMWSAAASIGAEAYSLAMVAAEFAQHHRGFRYSILATDVSTEVLTKAATAIFPAGMAEAVPLALRQRYMMRSRDRSLAETRIVPELRRQVSFARQNLNDPVYAIPRPVHVAFCRNVLIYFEKQMQQAVVSRICDCLAPGGYLFLGHSETIAGFALPLRQVAPTVFLRL
ncbi:Chemotaxis protein methyltransferase CheR [Magnetospirillum sp. XM-1]|uniref:CheR family methyltransferase n=1 Tax=Magnetospirillum sp. XM-1 TaxID=1663591 RepID=UPI00073E0824|nr:CheR family methyltransferase [Magnetospirillum sp. XM-1]CUW39576.1 Chemotaxis protein methyltransferase CheR [Magnetospirillum sp. XM-1]